MKRIIAAFAVLGVALTALRFAAPTLVARARQKCAELHAGTSSPCSPLDATAHPEASHPGASLAHAAAGAAA